MKKIGFISLGCEKNTVNTEKMMAACAARGWEVLSDPENADVTVINTCGFIEDAKREALETIFEIAERKKEGKVGKILITGCLAERYRDEIAAELPEADGFLGVGSFQRITEAIDALFAGRNPCWFDPNDRIQLEGARLRTSPRYTAYLKIAEGCNNRCAYCAIPAIRGPYRSRPMEAIVAEARELLESGAKELILIAQDTTNYGADLYGERRLPALIRAICALPGLTWLRLLYLYPDKITPELIALFAEEPKLIPYVEMAVQHGADRVLRAMHRPGSGRQILETLRALREKVPGVTVRTTLIVGFPGETEADFEELCRFVREAKFDKLGVFCYSREEGTPAYDLPGQVPEEVKQRRRDVIEEIQSEIVEEKQKALLGQTVTVLTEGYDRFAARYFGRSTAEAPEIDGKIFFTSGSAPEPGAFVRVRLEDTLDFDFLGTEETV